LRVSDLSSFLFDCLRSTNNELKKVTEVSQFLRKMTGLLSKVQKAIGFWREKRKRYFSSRGDHASKTLTKRRSQIISVKKNRYTRSNSYYR